MVSERCADPIINFCTQHPTDYENWKWNRSMQIFVNLWMFYTNWKYLMDYFTIFFFQTQTIFFFSHPWQQLKIVILKLNWIDSLLKQFLLRSGSFEFHLCKLCVFHFPMHWKTKFYAFCFVYLLSFEFCGGFSKVCIVHSAPSFTSLKCT